MRTLRRQRFWTTATLFLAMLFGIGGLPAYAAACGQPSAAVSQPRGEVCQASQKKNCQCCAPQRQAAGPQCHSGHAAGGGVHAAPRCGCAIDAPVNTPPANKVASGAVNSQPAVLQPVVVIHFARASVGGELLDGDDDPPRSDYRASAPSRAPPAP